MAASARASLLPLLPRDKQGDFIKHQRRGAGGCICRPRGYLPDREEKVMRRREVRVRTRTRARARARPDVRSEWNGSLRVVCVVGETLFFFSVQLGNISLAGG